MRGGSPSVVRAWVVAHDGVPVGAAVLVLALVLAGGSEWLLPVPGSVRVVPLWQLEPPVLAVLSSMATVNALPADVPGAALRVARVTWVAVVAGLVGACVWFVGLGTDLDSLVPATLLLVGLTFAVSCLVGRASVWVGGAAVVVIVLHSARYAGTANPWAPGSGLLWTAGSPTAVIGVAAYAWFGGRTVRLRSTLR